MKNIVINGEIYSGVSRVKLPTANGVAYFKDEDEIESSESGASGIPAEGAVVISGVLDIQTSLTTNQTFSFAHGCPRKPDIVVVYSNYQDVFSETNLPMSGYTMVTTGWDNLGKEKYYVIVTASNFNPGTAAAKVIDTALEGTMTVDNTQAHIQVTTSRKLDSRLTYRYVAVCL